MIFYRQGRLPKNMRTAFSCAALGIWSITIASVSDVLNIRLEEKDGQLIAHSERFLDRLGRPIDVCVSDGKLYVVEITAGKLKRQVLAAKATASMGACWK